MKTRSFEQSVQALDELVQQLEQGDMPLDQALSAYKNGIKIIQSCQKILSQAEKKIAACTSTSSSE